VRAPRAVRSRIPAAGRALLPPRVRLRSIDAQEKGTRMYRSRDAAGFTLIEVLIVVAIISILGAIAYPAYTDYILRSKISEAIANLSDMRTKMEQFFLDNRTYAGACAAGTVAPLPAGDNAKYFDYACPEKTATTYQVTATGKAAQGLSGLVLSIDQSNKRSTEGVPTGWTAPAGDCWVMKKDGSC
jgi:type IV pilus assembly protein PilE